MMLIIEAIKRAHRSLPVDVEGFAQDLGVRVNYAFLPQDLAGELVPNAEGSFDCNVNARHPRTRQRFTIAHELGHFARHRALIGAGINDDLNYCGLYSGRHFNPRIGPREENEANQFAVSLLMPRHLVEKLYREGLDTSAMARLLEVSEAGLALVLDDFGLTPLKRGAAEEEAMLTASVA